MSEETTQSRRDVLEAAFNEIDQDPTDATPPPEEGEASATPVEAAEPETEATTEPATGERARDPETGRFAKQEAKPDKPEVKPGTIGAPKPQPAAPIGEPKPEPVAQPPQPGVKAPQAWTPAAREAFAKAPPEVQREVERREREIAITLQQTVEARRLAQSVSQTLAPFEGLARANGTDPMTFAGNVLNTAYQLHAGTPQQKAAIVAQLIGSYGVDIDAINAVMQNPQAAPQQQRPQAFDIQSEIDRRFQEMAQQQEMQQNTEAIESFKASNPEFWDAVLPDMTELIRLDRARGGRMTLQQAYDRACKMNDEVQGVLTQRKAAEAAQKRAAEIQKAKSASSSVRNQPSSPPPASQPKGRRGVLEAKYEEIEGS